MTELFLIFTQFERMFGFENQTFFLFTLFERDIQTRAKECLVLEMDRVGIQLEKLLLFKVCYLMNAF